MQNGSLDKFKNHNFATYSKPSWCQQCEEFMWGLKKHHGYRCRVCKYLCHEKCIAVSTFKCPGISKKQNSSDDKLSISKRTTSSGSMPVSSAKPGTQNDNSNLSDPKLSENPKDGSGLTKIFIIHPMQNVLLDTLAKVPKDVLKRQLELSFSIASKSDNRESSQKSESNIEKPYNSTENNTRRISENITSRDNYTTKWHHKIDHINNKNIHMELVLEFNKLTNGLVFEVESDGTTFSGMINLYLRLTGPVNVENGGSLTLERALKKNQDKQKQQAIKSKISTMKSQGVQTFIIPSNTVATINIKSDNTVLQIIDQVLKKYNIICDPRKYGLYLETINSDERNNFVENNHNTLELGNNSINNIDQTTICPFHSNDCPLVNILKWGPYDCSHSIILKEIDHEDDMWSLFAVPELNNFIHILDNEETEFINKINAKYDKYTNTIQQLISTAK